jgi:signal transduction protein with GAF and PtsI domain
MTKSSQARIMRKKNEKLREKAKKMILKEYPNLMKDEEARKKTFQAVDNANVAVDKDGKVQILYEQDNNDLSKLN